MKRACGWNRPSRAEQQRSAVADAFAVAEPLVATAVAKAQTAVDALDSGLCLKSTAQSAFDAIDAGHIAVAAAQAAVAASGNPFYAHHSAGAAVAAGRGIIAAQTAVAAAHTADAFAVAAAQPGATRAEKSESSQASGRGAMRLEPKRKAIKRTYKHIHSEAHNAPFLPYDSKNMHCLPDGATVEERLENCCQMVEKKTQVQEALENPEKLPEGETPGLARKRVKYLDRQIAKEEKIISAVAEKKKERDRAAQIKYDKKMNAERMRHYEQCDKLHRQSCAKLLKDGCGEAGRMRAKTPQLIVQACLEEHEAAVAASAASPSSSNVPHPRFVSKINDPQMFGPPNANRQDANQQELPRDDHRLRDAVDDQVRMVDGQVRMVCGRWCEAL